MRLSVLLMCAATAAGAQDITATYPKDVVVDIEVFNVDGSGNPTRSFDTDFGPVVLQYRTSPNLFKGCCDDSISIVSRPKNTICLPACEMELGERETGKISIVEYWGG